MREDADVDWEQLVVAALVCWLATALLVGAVVGHAAALGAPDNM